MVKRFAATPLFILFALLVGCTLPPQAERRAVVSVPEGSGLSAATIARIASVYRGVLFGKEQQCGGTDCDVTINVRTVQVDSKEYCVATLPASLIFSGTNPGNPPKTITWNIDTGGVTGLAVEFHRNHGILIVDDARNQLNPDNARTSATKFRAKNKHNDMGSESSYVPVILRITGGLPELCATGDPKIVNN